MSAPSRASTCIAWNTDQSEKTAEVSATVPQLRRVAAASQCRLSGVEGARPPASPRRGLTECGPKDSPPFVNGVKGGAVTPHRGVGRAGQCVAGRAGGCRPSIAPGRARKCSRPRSAPTLPKGAKGSTASPRRPVPGFEGATSLASPAVIPWVRWLSRNSVAQASPAAARETLPAHRPIRRWPGHRGTSSAASRLLALRTAGRPVTRRFLATVAHPAAAPIPPTRTPGDPKIVALKRSCGP